MIETLTEEERISVYNHQKEGLDDPWVGHKALRIIDAHAAERAALTEQVAQLTAERDEARALVVRGEQLAKKAADTIAKLREVVEWECGLKNAFRPYQERAVKSESEVARLTEALAAAEQRDEARVAQVLEESTRAEAAERDRDAANAFLEALRRELEGRGGDLTRTTWSRLEQYCDERLSGCAEEDGTPCDVCGDGCAYGTRHPQCKPAAPAPTAAEARVREMDAELARFKGLAERLELNVVESTADANDAKAKLATAHHRHEETRQQLATCTSELAALRETSSEVLAAYNAKHIKAHAAESELAALRERVARAIKMLEPVNKYDDELDRYPILEVLRGSPAPRCAAHDVQRDPGLGPRPQCICRPVARCLVCGFENTGRAPYGCDCDKRESLRGK